MAGGLHASWSAGRNAEGRDTTTQNYGFIYSLRDRPYTAGDFTDKDASLRTRQIKLIGDYAIAILAVG